MTQVPGPAFDGLYGQMIMDHYRTPRNRQPLPGPTLSAYELNPFCGDLIDLQLLLDDGGAVCDVYANSEGCSIIQASSSMMSEALKGRTAAEMADLSAQFKAFLRDRSGAAEPVADLGDLNALGVVRQYPVRIKCASSPGPPWNRPSGTPLALPELRSADPPVRKNIRGRALAPPLCFPGCPNPSPTEDEVRSSGRRRNCNGHLG